MPRHCFVSEPITRRRALISLTIGTKNVDPIQQIKHQHSKMVFSFRRYSPPSNLGTQKSTILEEEEEEEVDDDDELNLQRE
jgi:hypothetical protein